MAAGFGPVQLLRFDGIPTHVFIGAHRIEAPLGDAQGGPSGMIALGKLSIVEGPKWMNKNRGYTSPFRNGAFYILAVFDYQRLCSF